MRVVTISLFRFLLAIAATGIGFCDGNSSVLCIASERQALLKLKQDLIDPLYKLSSWVEGGDCCKWNGVFCHNLTGHVNELHLGLESLPITESARHYVGWVPYYRSQLRGKINLSLLDLKHLSFLDLSINNFSGIPIPKFIGSLGSLTYLNLSYAQFQGAIPHELGNLSRLQFLDLRGNNRLNEAKNLQWLSGLSSLQYLDLSNVNLSKATDGLQVTNKLPFLLELHFSFCNLEDDLSAITFNSTNQLAVLDLSFNMLKGRVSTSLEHLCKLKVMDLSSNKIDQELSEILQSLSSCGLDRLESLSMADNQLSGPIPFSIGELSSLKLFDVSENKLNGTLPQSFGQLANLETLSFGHNLLEGVVTEMHFSNLKRLRILEASKNFFRFKPNSSWIPPFQCEIIELGNWDLGPQFPEWLQFQHNLYRLDISQARISDVIPTWFWNISSQFRYVNLSHNQLSGGISYFPEGVKVDLSWNKFTGPLPRVVPTLRFLFLSKNLFSGSLSDLVCDSSSEQMRILQIDKNLLSGEIPDCWNSWRELGVLNLGNNNLSGKIPHSLEYTDLSVLNLRSNSLFGELPSILQNCTGMIILDLSENQLTGSIPAWIGDKFSDLKVLSLRSNNFDGHIPDKICALKSLQNLDLGHNNILGAIPKCFSTLSAMARKEKMMNSVALSFGDGTNFLGGALLMIKGREDEYTTTLGLVTSIDLSANGLTGEISEELGNLMGLRSLNLSGNLLTGKIPKKVGNIELLESLDLSMNRLYGEIPSSLSNLTFLNHLNLSYNNLTGQIPSGTQLQSFDNFAYIGNHLCGPPVTKTCSPNGETPDVTKGGSSERRKGSKVNWIYVSIVLGFVMGFWGLVAPLFFFKSWRFAYYKKLEHIGDKLYVFWATVGK